MRRSFISLSVAFLWFAALLSGAALPAGAALEESESAFGMLGDGPPPPPGGEGDDEEEVLIRARPGNSDPQPALGASDRSNADALDLAFTWLARYLEWLGLR